MLSIIYLFIEPNHTSLSPKAPNQKKMQTVYAYLDVLFHSQAEPYPVATLKLNHIFIQTTSLNIFQNTHTQRNKF